MSKSFVTGEAAKNVIKKGTQQVADYVGVTLGPKGGNVLIEMGGDAIPKLTKDGVSVARQIRLEDPFDNAAAMSLIEISLKMLERVGDGTTTAIVFTAALINTMIDAKLSPKEQAEVRKIKDELIKSLKRISLDALDPDILTGVANISSNGDPEITDILKEAISHIGRDGTIVVEVDQSLKTRIVPEKGFYLPYGFNTYELPNQKVSDYKDPYFIIYEETLQSFSCMDDLLSEHVAREGLTPIVIVANHVTQDAMMGIMRNVLARRINLTAISLDESPEKCATIMQDLSSITGIPMYGKKYDKVFGTEYNKIKHSDLQKVSSVRIKKDSTLILPNEGNAEHVNEYIALLQEQISSNENETQRKELKERIARLSQTVAVIKIGGLTHQTTMEKKDRIEDAVCAVLSAREHGVLPGAGSPIINSIFYLTYLNEYSELSKSVLEKAFKKTLQQLFKNTGHEDLEKYEMDCDLVLLNDDDPKDWKGLNLATDEIVNLFDARIFDPTAVIINTLETGVEAAIKLMNTDVIMIKSRKLDPNLLSLFAPNSDMSMNPMMSMEE